MLKLDTISCCNENKSYPLQSFNLIKQLLTNATRRLPFNQLVACPSTFVAGNIWCNEWE